MDAATAKASVQYYVDRWRAISDELCRREGLGILENPNVETAMNDMSERDTILTMESITKTFGPVKALTDVNLSVAHEQNRRA